MHALFLLVPLEPILLLIHNVLSHLARLKNMNHLINVCDHFYIYIQLIVPGMLFPKELQKCFQH